jgi:PAS domain S-box-containing protein
MPAFDPRALLDAIADPVIAADGSDRIVYVNAAAERLFAWSAGDLHGQLLDVLLPDRLRRQHPGFFRHLLEEVPEPRRVHAVRKDGVELDVELSLGSVGSLLVACVRTLREDPRSPADERYRLVFDNAPVGLLHWDAYGVVTECNNAMLEILGSTKAVTIGLNLLTLQGDPIREKMSTLIRQALEGKPVRYEGPYTSQTGQKTTHLHALLAPIHGPSGVLGGLGIIEDVSDRKRIEAALARADRMASIGTLAAGVAHEINNPLVYVTLGLELIGRELQRLRSRTEPPTGEDWERVRTWSTDALDGAERVRSIVRDLRTFSRAEDERTGPVDVEKVLDSSINVAISHIRPRARLLREYQTLLPVLADESRLGQVFLNLLVNAAQAIPEGAPATNRIVVRTRQGPAQEVVVEVEDTGVGIEPWKLERIFEPFWTDKAVGVGTGLGLSIVHGIVSALGGDIQVQSAPGRGTTFRVTLPVQSAPHPGAARPPPPPAAVSGRRPRLLLIDDEAHLGVTLSLGLRDQADVASVRNGSEAVRMLLADDRFDLILCDLMMPDLTGMDVFEQVGRERPALRARFVFMTGGAVTERARKFLEQVPEQRLDKPFRLEQVEALLRRGVTPS